MSRLRVRYTRSISDYQRIAAHLTMVQHGAYSQLLDHYIIAKLNGQKIAHDEKSVCRLLRANTFEEITAVEYVMKAFFEPDDDGNLRHLYADVDTDKVMGVSEKRRAAAAKRWAKTPRHANAYANAMQMHAPPNPTIGGGGVPPEELGTVPAKNQNLVTSRDRGESPERGVRVKIADEMFDDAPPKPPKGGHTLAVWLDYLKAAGQKAFAPNDPIFAWCKDTKVPPEFVSLAWSEFKDRHITSTKRYNDWRRAFRNCVKDNWYRMWFVNNDGAVALTTVGELARRRHSEKKEAA